jgi:hypothetical protein
MNWLSGGYIIGGLTLLSAIATAFGKPPLAAFLSDPATASTLQTVINGVLALAAGAMQGIKPVAK